MRRPLEPNELLERCDLAGEARVLTIQTNRSGVGAIARLEFTSIVKGRVENFRNELQGIARVESAPPPTRPIPGMIRISVSFSTNRSTYRWSNWGVGRGRPRASSPAAAAMSVSNQVPLCSAI
jgi:hypothetical protein